MAISAGYIQRATAVFGKKLQWCAAAQIDVEGELEGQLVFIRANELTEF